MFKNAVSSPTTFLACFSLDGAQQKTGLLPSQCHTWGTVKDCVIARPTRITYDVVFNISLICRVCKRNIWEFTGGPWLFLYGLILPFITLTNHKSLFLSLNSTSYMFPMEKKVIEIYAYQSAKLYLRSLDSVFRCLSSVQWDSLEV